MMIKRSAASAAVIAVLMSAPTLAQVDLSTEPVAAEAMQTTIAGEVMVVNTDTRRMTLKTADGSYQVFHVPA